jgi:hypothetical protein
LFKLATSSSNFKPLYAAIAEQGFHSFRAFSIKKADGNFLDYEGCFDLNQSHGAWMRFEEAQDVWLQPQEANVSSVISSTAAIVLLPATDFWPT